MHDGLGMGVFSAFTCVMSSGLFRLAPVAYQLLKMERDLFPLLGGGWMAADCAPHQQQWRAAVSGATDPRQLAAAAVRLESALRRTTLPEDWDLLPGVWVPLGATLSLSSLCA